jgi:hypothetical protein|tara:strand:+ start:4813 stop:5079 length:267 start_codon:yes stop_codon:yes gene_type:complete
MSKQDEEPVELTMILFYKTEKAVLMGSTEGSNGIWLPKSQITEQRIVGRTKPGVRLGRNKPRLAPKEGAPIVQFKLAHWLAANNHLVD